MASYQCYGIKGFDYFQAVRPLPIKSLQVGRKTCMVDDPPHWWAMEEHATFYRGHVVVAGLGLGLIVHALAACPGVERVTVVEVEPDVITLVQPHLPPSAKVEIVAGDFWDWEGRPDGVFYDLFVGDGSTLAAEALRTMLDLRERFPGATTLRIHGFNNAKLWDMTEEIAPSAGWLGRSSGAVPCRHPFDRNFSCWHLTFSDFMVCLYRVEAHDIAPLRHNHVPANSEPWRCSGRRLHPARCQYDP